MDILLLFVGILLLMFIGVPIAIALGVSSILFLVFYHHGSLVSVAQTLFSAFEGHYTLLAIPFFILASSFMSTGGIAARIVRFTNAAVGHLPGGLAIASVFACMIFAALSGSSPATVISVGSLAIAGMQKYGYKKEFAAGIICNAGTLGILIPPSIVMVVYAAATDVSVGRMFLAGVLPGLLAGGMLMLGVYIYAKYKNLPRQPRASFQEFSSSLGSSIWGLMLIAVIMGGIYSGAFTPTEAAAVAVVYAFIVANFVYRDVGPFAAHNSHNSGNFIFKVFSVFWHPDTRKTLLESAKLSIMLMFIIANALILKHVLTEERVPQAITEAMLALGLGPIAFLIIVNIILLIGGQFMEPSGLIIIVAPILFPIALAFGIDPIHLGIIMVVNMEIGMITPPVGLNLFVTSGVAKMSVANVVKAASPWVVIMFFFLIIITYIPFISTWLPTLVMGPEIITS